MIKLIPIASSILIGMTMLLILGEIGFFENVSDTVAIITGAVSASIGLIIGFYVEYWVSEKS
ncbi:MAG: hypothetical protein JRJ62_00190 [Deltaproteobacteria bacterium]|nr:hypothetical protein [Deltaproteobacteria bacterium]